MKKPNCLLRFLVSFPITFYIVIPLPSIAQITPDATLPNHSIVTPEGNTSVITGGTKVGSNLFHSFQNFSIHTDGTAYFNNGLDIKNIFSRVTGGAVSNINGLIKTNGTANFFLINPNGLFFGSNARLNTGGSFLATTASSIKFSDGTQFSANNPQNNSPLLTINVPVGLSFSNNSGTITVRGTGSNITKSNFSVNTNPGLQVQNGQTLALVGGELNIDGGILTALEGQIELGSVSSGTVTVNPNSSGWILSYRNVPLFSNILLSHKALLDVSGISSGSIEAQGKNVILTEGAQFVNTNQGSESSGNINFGNPE